MWQICKKIKNLEGGKYFFTAPYLRKLDIGDIKMWILASCQMFYVKHSPHISTPFLLDTHIFQCGTLRCSAGILTHRFEQYGVMVNRPRSLSSSTHNSVTLGQKSVIYLPHLLLLSQLLQRWFPSGFGPHFDAQSCQTSFSVFQRSSVKPDDDIYS